MANCQVGVFLCYASVHGAAFVDRALYLPQAWTKDSARRQHAHVPEEVDFATKPRLGQPMLQRVLDTGLVCRWVLGDSVYGSDRPLREMLRGRGQAFLLGIASDEWGLWRAEESVPARWLPAKALGACLKPSRWQRLACGEGSKGSRLYDGALEPRSSPGTGGKSCEALLVRRRVEDPGKVAFFRVFDPHEELSLARIVGVAGQRWQIETCFEQAKGECGLGDYDVRQWQAWYRHITLALVAHAFLSRVRAEASKGAMRPARPT